MNLRFAAVLLGLVLTLAGCGVFGGEGSSLGVHFQPTLIGFEVDDDGTIVTVANNVYFSNAAGGQQARVIGYSVNYVDRDRNPVLGGTYDLENNLGSAINVPPGYVCEGEAESCGPFDRQPVPAQSEPVSHILLAGQIARWMVEMDMIGAPSDVIAQVAFTVEQGGRTFELVSELSVIYPVAGEE